MLNKLKNKTIIFSGIILLTISSFAFIGIQNVKADGDGNPEILATFDSEINFWAPADWIMDGMNISAEWMRDNFQYLFELTDSNEDRITELEKQLKELVVNNITEINEIADGGEWMFVNGAEDEYKFNGLGAQFWNTFGDDRGPWPATEALADSGGAGQSGFQKNNYFEKVQKTTDTCDADPQKKFVCGADVNKTCVDVNSVAETNLYGIKNLTGGKVHNVKCVGVQVKKGGKAIKAIVLKTFKDTELRNKFGGTEKMKIHAGDTEYAKICSDYGYDSVYKPVITKYHKHSGGVFGGGNHTSLKVLKNGVWVTESHRKVHWIDQISCYNK